ncbi:MAG: HAD family phosphatase [Clostridiales bacterium]|nr:HAD family phosphatase [Clostridiales bacterium]
MYKLLALDIDGTLLDSEGHVSESTLEAIKRVQNKGVLVTISTGRPIQGVYKYIKMLDLKAPIITYNGAMIIDSEKDKVIYEQKLDRKDAKQIIDLGRVYDTTMVIWSNNKLYVNRLDDHVIAYQTLSGEAPIVINNYEEVYNQGITKIIWINEPDKLIQYQDEIKSVANESVTYCTSKPHYLEFFDHKVSKAKALAFIGRHCNIKKEEMMAIGDGNNDIEMIEYVGMGVAMGNATPLVKSVANYITSSNNNDGIFKALEKLI